MSAHKSDGADDDLTRVTARIPRSLHDALARRRDETGKSQNDLLVEAIARFLDVPVPMIAKGIPGPKPRRGS